MSSAGKQLKTSEAAPLRARMPLFMVLLGVVLSVSLAPLAAFSFTALRSTSDALKISQQEQQLQDAISISQLLDAFITQKGSEVVKFGALVGALPQSQTDLYLETLLEETVALVRYERTGYHAIVLSAPQLLLSEEVERTLKEDSALLLEQGAMPMPPSARDAIVSGPFTLGPERVLVMTVSAPVQRAGRMIGVLQQVVVVQKLWSDIESSVVMPTRLLLLDPRGDVVAASSGGPDMVGAAVTQREIVRQFIRSPRGSTGSQVYAVAGADGLEKNMLGSYASTVTGWGVFVEVEESAAQMPVKKLQNDMMMGGAVAAGLAILAAFIIGGIVSRPITRLAAISRRLEQGDFSVRASPSKVREIDELSHSFNHMAQRIGELVDRFRLGAREANAMFLGIIRAMAEAIDEKDPYTKGHSVRVNRYAVIIGRYLGLSREQIKSLHVASVLHDVGKIGINDAILQKPSALTPAEFEVMKTHTDRGAKIVMRIPQMRKIIPGVRFHHERWIGGGYPMGLKGEEIPLQARIIAVADTFDAMTTTRPYQAPFEMQDAVARINDLKGINFDPEVVEAFNRAYEAGDIQEVLQEVPGPDPDVAPTGFDALGVSGPLSESSQSDQTGEQTTGARETGIPVK